MSLNKSFYNENMIVSCKDLIHSLLIFKNKLFCNFLYLKPKFDIFEILVKKFIL